MHQYPFPVTRYVPESIPRTSNYGRFRYGGAPKPKTVKEVIQPDFDAKIKPIPMAIKGHPEFVRWLDAYNDAPDNDLEAITNVLRLLPLVLQTIRDELFVKDTEFLKDMDPVGNKDLLKQFPVFAKLNTPDAKAKMSEKTLENINTRFNQYISKLRQRRVAVMNDFIENKASKEFLEHPKFQEWYTTIRSFGPDDEANRNIYVMKFADVKKQVEEELQLPIPPLEDWDPSAGTSFKTMF